MIGLLEYEAALGPPLMALATDALSLGRWRLPRAEVFVPRDGALRLVLPITPPTSVRHRTRRGERWVPPASGIPVVLDPREDLFASVEGPFDSLLVALTGWAAPPSDSVALPVLPGNTAAQARILNRLLAMLAEGDAEPLALDLAAAALAEVTTAPAPQRHRGGLTPAQLRHVDDVVAARLDLAVPTSPTLGEMAAAAGVSIYHFAREFHRTTGMTPYAFAMGRRLARVATALATTDAPLGRIAAAHGFASVSHLARRFGAGMGVSPGRLRAAVRAG